MIERLLLANVWFAVALTAICYIATYLLGLYELYLYHTTVKEYVVIPLRYNLRPGTQAFVLAHKWFTWKLVAVSIVQSIGIWAAWQVAIGQYNRSDVFAAILGGALLLELTDIALRVHNIVFYFYLPKDKNATGKIEYSPRLVSAQTFYDLYIFAAIYLFVFLATGSWLFFGGGITCIIAGRRQRDWTVIKT